MRPIFVLLHRYVGLVMALFLIIAGITGALLVWYEELEGIINRDLHHVQAPADKADFLDPLELANKVETTLPQAAVRWLPLRLEPGHSVTFWLTPKIDPETGKRMQVPYDEVFVNPYTGEILGGRHWGDISEGIINLMPFIYKLHYTLALGTIGTTVFGIIALLWTLDCFIAFILTLPRSGPVWQKWKPAWGIKRKRLNYDIHRAGGLWPWAMLFVFAWSSVAFNLHDVYSPVTKALFDYRNFWEEVPDLPTPLTKPALDFATALQQGRALADEEASRYGFAVEGESMLQYLPRKGVYRYRFTSDKDILDHGGGTQVMFDGNTGDHVWTALPTGQYSGNTVTNWLFALHLADVGGMPYRIFVFVLGIAVAVLSVTGVVIWWRKRRARLSADAKLSIEAKRPIRFSATMLPALFKR